MKVFFILFIPNSSVLVCKASYSYQFSHVLNFAKIQELYFVSINNYSRFEEESEQSVFNFVVLPSI